MKQAQGALERVKAQGKYREEPCGKRVYISPPMGDAPCEVSPTGGRLIALCGALPFGISGALPRTSPVFSKSLKRKVMKPNLTSSL